MRESGFETSPWKLLIELDPNRTEFDHLTYAPFVLDLRKIDYRELGFRWGDLRIDGYIQGKQVISKAFSGRRVDRKFIILPDETSLFADGADSTRVVLRVTDEFDAVRTYANDPIPFSIEGLAQIIGDTPFSLIGGTGAIWIRAKEQAGKVRFTAKHPRLGSRSVELTLNGVLAEVI